MLFLSPVCMGQEARGKVLRGCEIESLRGLSREMSCAANGFHASPAAIHIIAQARLSHIASCAMTANIFFAATA